MTNIDIIDKLKGKRIIEKAEFIKLITTIDKDEEEYLYAEARKEREKHYGKDVYLRGLIELSPRDINSAMPVDRGTVMITIINVFLRACVKYVS